MTFTVSELGVLLLLLFGIFYWLSIFANATALAGLVGVVLTGTTGWLGRILSDIAGWAQHLTSTVTANVIGASLTATLFICLAVVYAHDLHPRHQTGKRTAWIGVALGALIVAGVTGIPALAGVHQAIVGAANNVLSIL